MSVAETRGGIPYVVRAAVDATGRKFSLPFYTKYVKIRITDNPCRMYFTKEDFDAANDKYVLIPIQTAATPHGEWDAPLEAGDLWLKGEGGTSNVELVAFQRRG